MSQKTFTKTRIATSLSMILGATALPAMSAEEANAEQAVEVITVTGMRSSIKESTRLKRDARVSLMPFRLKILVNSLILT